MKYVYDPPKIKKDYENDNVLEPLENEKEFLKSVKKNKNKGA